MRDGQAYLVAGARFSDGLLDVSPNGISAPTGPVGAPRAPEPRDPAQLVDGAVELTEVVVAKVLPPVFVASADVGALVERFHIEPYSDFSAK